MSGPGVPTTRAVLASFAKMGGQSSRRETAVALGLFAMPVFVMLVVGLALRGYSTPRLSVGVLEPLSPAAREVVDRLAGDPHMSLRFHSDRERMRVAVYRGRLHGGLVFPPGWDGVGDPELILSTAGAGAPVMRILLDRALAGDLPASLGSRFDVVDGDALGSPPVGYQYTAPSNLVLFVMVNGIMGAAGIVALRRTGLGTRLLTTPATPLQLMLAFTLLPLQLMAVQAVFLIAVGALVFDVSWGSPLGVALVTGALILAGATLSVLIGTLFRSESQVTAVGPFLSILLGMLGGCMWPLEIVPDWVARLGHAAPTAWAMDGYLALIFGRVAWPVVLPSAAALLGMAAVFAALGTLRLRRQLSGR